MMQKSKSQNINADSPLLDLKATVCVFFFPQFLWSQLKRLVLPKIKFPHYSLSLMHSKLAFFSSAEHKSDLLKNIPATQYITADVKLQKDK